MKRATTQMAQNPSHPGIPPAVGAGGGGGVGDEGIGLLLALQETSLGDGSEPGRWVQAEEMGTSLGEATRFVRNTGSMGCDAWNVLNEVRLLIRWIVSGLREARACIPGYSNGKT